MSAKNENATADERLTAGMQVFLECLRQAGTQVEKLDKTLIDHHITDLDRQIGRQSLYSVPHFQVEGMDVNLSLVSPMPKAKS